MDHRTETEKSIYQQRPRRVNIPKPCQCCGRPLQEAGTSYCDVNCRNEDMIEEYAEWPAFMFTDVGHG